ncbi:unnamed protein product [Phytophthora fragariaefolia]|uniref:Unnamed protein product n=1 Tax=Phytophthora fragariaefolia TaxID=1490495 RepID=A0A9W7CRV4_9STRA|nr:unnamed protein product [Phytophthora fragariaefolia]
MSLRFRKYYKSLALGLIDIAIVDSFLVIAPDGATGGTVEENRDNGSNDGAANEEEGGAGNREEEDRAGNKESDNTGHEEGDNTAHEEGDNTGHEEGTDKENPSRSGGAAD